MQTTFSNCLERLIALDGEHPSTETIPASWRQWHSSQSFAELTPTLSQPPLRPESALLLTLQWQHHAIDVLHLHPHFVTATQSFWWAIATTLLRDWSLFLSSRHPLTFVAEQLLLWGRVYEPGNSAAAKELKTLENLCRDIAQQAFVKPEAMMQALKRLHEHLQQLQQLQRHNDRQLLLQEEKERRSNNCQAAVSRVIRRAIYGHPVPALITDFLDTTWRRYLYQIYLQHGMEDASWQQAVHDLELLVWLGGEASADEVKAAQKTHFISLRDRLRAAVTHLRQETQLRVDFFTELDFLIDARARNAPDAGLPLGELPFDDDDEHVNSPTHNVRELSQLPLQVGDAIWFTWQGKTVRARLIELDQVNEALLLADCWGDKVATVSREQFAQLYERDEFVVMPEPALVQWAADKLTPLLEKAWQAAESTKRESVAARRREREAEMAAQLDERRKQEAAMRAERVAQARQEAEEKQKRQFAEQQIDGLRSGAMLHLSLNKGPPRNCFLALINARTGLYVVVDRQGQRIAELPRQQMVDLLLTRQLEILESGSALNTSSLSELVRERREFLNDSDKDP